MKRISAEIGKKIGLWLVFTIIPMLTFAQYDPNVPFDPDSPCDDSDPLDNLCPLDSWVYMAILVIIAVVFVGYYLRKEARKELEKQRNAEATPEFN